MKKIISVLLVLSLAFAFAACSKGGENGETPTQPTEKVITATVDEVAATLTEKLIFIDTEIEKYDRNEKTLSLFDLDETVVTELADYKAGSGATAEEVLVFKCADSEGVEKVYNACLVRVQELHDLYSNYQGRDTKDAVAEIDSAAIQSYGNIVVFVICKNPDAVESIIIDL